MDIYVGNLPYSTADHDLRELFETYGQVDGAKVIIDRETGRSRGFGFVQMGVADEAAEAIRNTDGEEFMGRRLRVNEAQPKEPRNGGGGGGGNRRQNW